MKSKPLVLGDLSVDDVVVLGDAARARANELDRVRENTFLDDDLLDALKSRSDRLRALATKLGKLQPGESV